MSNKIVPSAYRAIIDDVIGAIKAEFDEYGVSEDVLADLQTKWEEKVVASNVAEFDPPTHVPYPQQPTAPVPHPPPQTAAIAHPSQQHPYPTPSHYQHYAPPPGPTIKAEPTENRIPYGHMTPYAHIPPLPGPQLNVNGRISVPVPPPLRFPPTVPNGSQVPRIPQSDGPSGSIPQVDGPSSSDSESGTPPPRTSHPSLPQPMKSETAAADTEEINSDLDDSDSDNEAEDDGGGAGGDVDIVFCTYDKVARVKNKWKCVLRDGMIHLNGKDYLFSKCSGEFEW